MGDQAPEVARAERRTGGTMELFRLQQVISELGRQEKRLRLQRAQLEDYIARYKQQSMLAQEANREDVAEEALALSHRLQAYLPALQQHMSALQSRREPLIQQQQDLLARLGAAFQQEEAADRPDDQEGAPQPRLKPPVPAPRRASRKLLAALCALVVMVVVTPLALLRGHGLGHPPASATQGHPTPTLPPPPSPITFTSAGTAPTSQDCQNNVGTACYSPEQIQRAFHLTTLYQQGYDGQGQTIVIVGAGHSAHLKQDLHQFDLAWGLPDPPSFQILQPRGAPTPYDCGLGGDALELENTLDVEWSHAIAPGANIVLLIWPNGVPDAPPQANCGIIGLDGAVAYALDHQLGQIISISYGGSELGDLSETAADKADDQRLYARGHAIFQRAAAARVTVLAATGDNGVTNPNDFSHPGSFWPTPNVSWPASDPYVLAVGGTQLQLTDAAGDRGGEQVWNEGKAGGATGGGLSAVFAEPDYQKALPNQKMLKGRRGLPDVAFPAALNYSLYASSSSGALGKANPARWNHWDVIGGTSASTPCWAGLIALADQLEGSSLGLIQPALYALGGQGMNDITQSDNSFGGVPGYKALPGYDLATGWGTPIADQFIPALLAVVNRIQPGCLGSVRACS